MGEELRRDNGQKSEVDVGVSRLDYRDANSKFPDMSPIKNLLYSSDVQVQKLFSSWTSEGSNSSQMVRQRMIHEHIYITHITNIQSAFLCLVISHNSFREMTNFKDMRNLVSWLPIGPSVSNSNLRTLKPPSAGRAKFSLKLRNIL